MGWENRSDCHVLVIGSGGAGIRAAVEAEKYGTVTIISKTITGKGGCTVMAEGGYNAVLSDTDAASVHFEDTVKGGAYLNDEALVEALVSEAPARIREGALKASSPFHVRYGLLHSMSLGDAVRRTVSGLWCFRRSGRIPLPS